MTHLVLKHPELPAWPIWSARAQAHSTCQTLSAPSPVAGCHMHSPQVHLQSDKCRSCTPEGPATLVFQDHTMGCKQQSGNDPIGHGGIHTESCAPWQLMHCCAVRGEMSSVLPFLSSFSHCGLLLLLLSLQLGLLLFKISLYMGMPLIDSLVLYTSVTALLWEVGRTLCMPLTRSFLPRSLSAKAWTVAKGKAENANTPSTSVTPARTCTPLCLFLH